MIGDITGRGNRASAVAQPGMIGAQLRRALVIVEELRWSDWALLIGALALVVRLPYIVGPANARYWPDSGVYSQIANDLLHGQGFHAATEFRTPLYPLFIAGVSLISGQGDPNGFVEHLVVILQHLVGAALALAIARATWRYFGRLPGVLVGLLAAMSPVLVNVESDLMPDFFVGAFAVIGTLFLIRALETDRPRLRLIAASGVSYGLAALMKPVGQALILTAVVPIIVNLRRPRQGFLATAVLAASLFLTISPWLIRNAVQYGDFRMSDQDGPALWLREFDWDLQPIPTGTADGRLAKKLYDASVGREPADAHPKDTYEFVLELLTSPPYNYTLQQAAAFERRVALQAIRANPRTYVDGTWLTAKEMANTDQERRWARSLIQQRGLQEHHRLPNTLSFAGFGVVKFMTRWSWLLSLHLCAALLLPFTRNRLQRVAALAFGVAWLAIIAATGATTFPDYRYSSEVAPLIWPLLIASSILVVVALSRQVARGLRRGPVCSTE
jgi:4-amino-4-deoxy-L-arabinose transferase-like glycosyltransferase